MHGHWNVAMPCQENNSEDSICRIQFRAAGPVGQCRACDVENECNPEIPGGRLFRNFLCGWERLDTQASDPDQPVSLQNRNVIVDTKNNLATFAVPLFGVICYRNVFQRPYSPGRFAPAGSRTERGAVLGIRRDR